MNWNLNILCFWLLIVNCGVFNLSGYPIDSLKETRLETRSDTFDRKQCSSNKELSEIGYLAAGLQVNPTHRELVIIIGSKRDEGSFLADFITDYEKLRPYFSNLSDSFNFAIQEALLEYYDFSENITYYVHPGLSSNDRLLYNFLTKNAIDYATKVKIILTCSYDNCVRKLLEDAQSVISDISKYKSSVALVVTNGRMRSEEKKNFQITVETLLEELERSSNKVDQTMYNLAEPLLETKKIAVVDSFIDSKLIEIRKLVKKLPFTSHVKTDFKYEFSPSQRIVATCLCINQPMPLMRDVLELVTEIRHHYTLQEKNINTTNFHEVLNFATKVEEDYTYLLSSYKKLLENLTSSRPLFNKIKDITEHLNIPLSANTSLLLYQQERLFNFIYDAALTVELDSDLWVTELNNYLKGDLFKLKRWYTTLREISNMNLKIDDYKQLQRLEDAIKLVENTNPISENAKLKSEAFKTVKLATFTRNLTSRCIPINNGVKLEVRGDIISLSYVKSNKCQGTIKFIEIFALDKVLIDEDLSFVGQELQLVIVAPIWQILGSRRFDLSGEDGKRWENPKAKNGVTNGNKLGVNGKPGLPGGPAGNFYGIAKTIMNSQKLMTIAAGGNGGPGQDGGDGGNGEDGQTYDPAKDPMWNQYTEQITGWEIGYGTKPDKGYINYDRYIFMSDKYRRVFSKPGQNGGKGGDGGFGGRGGRSGDIKTLELEQNSYSHINVFNPSGNIGAIGAGGKGGEGGSNGEDVIMHYSWEGDRMNTPYASEYIPKGNAPAGPDGKTSFLLGRRPPKHAPVVQSFTRTVNNYKNYAREHFVYSVRNNKLEDFHTLLNNCKEIISSYGILDLIEEFIDLENQFNKLTDVRVLFPSYDNLLERVDAYRNKLEQGETSEAYISLVYNMYSDLAERVKKNKMHGDYPIKTAIRSEYDTLQTNYINELSRAQTVETFTNILEDTVKHLDRDIDDGRNFLNMIQSSIEDVESNLDDDLDSLVAEVLNQRQTQKKKIDDLNEQTKQIQKSIENKILFGVSKAIFQALSLINPTLGAVGSAASSILTVVENNSNSKPNTITSIGLRISIPKGLRLDFKSVEGILKIKKEALGKLIKQKEKIIQEAMKTLPEKDGKVLKRWNSLGDLEKEIKSAKPLRLTYRTIESKFEAQKKKLIKEAQKEGYKYTAALGVFDKLQSACQITQMLGGVAEKVAGDHELLKSIGITIAKANQNLKELRVYEDTIYEAMVPVLEDIRVNLNDKMQDFSNMSTIHLEAAKWNITSNLNTVKIFIVKMTQEYKAHDYFVWTLDKLTDTVNKLISVNAKIREIEEKKRENRFLVSLHINSLQEIPLTWFIADSQVSRAFSILKDVFLRNSLQQAYNEWLHSFKQYVFPNTEHVSKLPEVYNFSSDTRKLQTAIKGVDLVLKAYANNDLPKNSSSSLFFRSLRQTSHPFHIWNGQQYAKEIANLLTGKKVSLFANISEHKENYAVKFNLINMSLYAEDKDLLEELNEDLKHFAVRLTHEGDSFYRCGENIFLVKNSPTTITYGFDFDSMYTADKYMKVTGKDYMLSPYATWSIQLVKLTPIKDFGDLEKYKNLVDLELGGMGMYFKDRAIKCDGELGRHYRKIDNLSEFRK